MVYADYNGTSPLSVEVKKYLKNRLESELFANPNATHHLGEMLRGGLEKARRIISESLGAENDQIIFTSGATESLATVIEGHVLKNIKTEKRVFLTSSFEHKAVLENMKKWEVLGFKTIEIPVTKSGLIDFNEFNNLISQYGEQIALCSIMAANNEIGTIQPFEEIGIILKNLNIPFLCDTSQYIGKLPFNFSKLPIDFAVVSGHKLGALPGIGLIIAKDRSQVRSLIEGGGQEFGLRGGTQNYLGIETLAVVCNALSSDISKWDIIQTEKEKFENLLINKIPEAVIFGKDEKRLPNTTALALPGLHGQAIQIELESRDIFLTTSSACSDNEPLTSHVLKAMNIDDRTGRGMVRISTGLKTNHQDYERILEGLERSYKRVQQIGSHSY